MRDTAYYDRMIRRNDWMTFGTVAAAIVVVPASLYAFWLYLILLVLAVIPFIVWTIWLRKELDRDD